MFLKQDTADYQSALPIQADPRLGNLRSPNLAAVTGMFIFLAIALLPSRSFAEVYTCLICDKVIPPRGKVYTYQATNYICLECAKLDTHCSLCGLPVKLGFFKTTDGRYICRRDLPNAVVSQDEAQRLFDDTRREVGGICYNLLELKTQSVEVRMFDVDYWNTAKGEPDSGTMHTLGFSASRALGDSYTHNVILLSGKLKSEVAATCAHELTHLWINENRGKTHKIEQDTVEGICELIGYKLAVSRNDLALQERIKKNSYTKGRILELIQLEPQVGLPAILEWVKSGTTETINLESYGLVAKPPPPASTTLPRFVVADPDKLVLSGILKTGGKRKAIINRQPFETGDENNIKIGNKIVTVHCVEIQSNSVVITVDNSPERTTLKLE